MYLHYVCELTERYRRGGGVVVGHMAKLSMLPAEQLAVLARRLADIGIAVTVLPATDLFMMRRDQDHNVRRGVGDANFLVAHSVNCSLTRMANLYANVLQIAGQAQLGDCFAMLTERSARLLDLADCGLAVGNPADVVVIDAATPEQAITALAFCEL